MKVRVPVKAINEDGCVDLKRGCFLEIVSRYVMVSCSKDVDIPQSIVIDVGNCKKGDVIKVSKIQVPVGVKVELPGKAKDLILARVASE